MALRSLMLVSKELQSLLRSRANVIWIRNHQQSKSLWGEGAGELFKLRTIMKYWETIPIFVTAFIAASFPIIHTIFRLTHAEDIRLLPGSKMKNQKHRWILEGPPKPTLYMVRNQKWVWPQGLLDALREDGDQPKANDSSDAGDSGRKDGDKCKPKKVSFTFWQKD